ncbi:hypothetical protein PUT07_31495 [Paenibacillus sp. MAHUQ-63]|nr:hypothetical protein [Paenibacillus sp. MAHUQ-63]MDD9271590.1 hypothetical protein [Paenibacillus sp. MAHUQ-63]
MYGDRIRARYGRSHDKVQYPVGEPPVLLFHGTNAKAAPVILKEGMQAMAANTCICPKGCILPCWLAGEEGS